MLDLGPEGGERGGKLIAEGPPEQITEVSESFTGRYLRETLGGTRKPKPIPKAKSSRPSARR